MSHDGFVQYSKTLDNVGVLAREVEPAARTLSAMAGEDPRDERTHGVSAGAYGETAADTDLSALDELTIGIPEELDGNAPRLDEVTHAALDRLAAHGATLTEVSIPDYEYALPGWLAIGMTEMSNYFDARGLNYWALSDPRTELVAALDEALTSDPEELGSRTLAAWLYGQHLASAHGNQYYALAQTARRRVTEGVDTALADVDVLASTTVPLLPPEWGEGIDDVFAALSNTGIFNLTGHPAISVRAGSVDGLPTGLQFIGGHFEESAICQAAACWERLRNDEFD